MKYRTNQEKRERKAKKSMGTWPVKQKEKPLFACEKVLADAKPEVQYLLQNAMTAKKTRQQILSQIREKKPYTKLSDAKTKIKHVMMHPKVKVVNKKT